MRIFTIPIAIVRVFPLLMALAVPMSARADIVYGVTGAGGGSSVLLTLNPATGTVNATIGPITLGGAPLMVSGISFNPLNQGLYGVGLDPVSGKSELLTINVNTGLASVVGPLNLTPPSINPTSLAFSPSGGLFAYVKQGSQPESLFTLNPATGAATLVGASGLTSSGNGMAFNSSGTLYFAGKGAAGTLSTLSTTTGLATSGPTLTGAPLSGSQMKGLAFDENGAMYGIDLQTSTLLANFVKINPATGLISDIGPSQNGLAAIAFQPIAVPEPSSFVFVGVAALGAIMRLRRVKLAKAAVQMPI